MDIIAAFSIGVLLGVLIMIYLPLMRFADAWLRQHLTRQQETHRAQLDMWKAHNQAKVDQRAILTIIDRAQRGARFRHTESALRATRHDGYVYLICMNNEYYKIGYAADVQARYLSIRSSSPYATKLVHVIATEHMARLERLLHDQFADKRMDGEWFNLASDDVTTICGLASPVTVDYLDRQAF